MMARLFLAICLILWSFTATAGMLIHGGAQVAALGFQGTCNVLSAGCAEVWNVQRAVVASYAGALLRITNTTNSTTLDIVQDGSHKADTSTWSAFCGGTNTTTSGITTNSHCVTSKIYAQVQGSANDAVPSVFSAPFGPDCSAGGNTCACPFAIEVATGLPILNTAAPCEYTLASDGNATGITAGTSSLSLFYEGIAQTTTYCCGPAGIGHAYNVTDTFGTTFYLSVAQGQFSNSSGNQSQTSTSYSSGLDEESIGDLVDYSSTNIGSVFAAGAFDSAANKVSSYINGGQLRSPITPAAALCTSCVGINLPRSVHIGGGGDLSQPTPAVMRGFGLTNGVISQSDVTAAYSNIKAFYSGSLTFTDYTAPATVVTVAESAPGAVNASSGTSASTSFGSAVTTGKHGVVVGLAWCGDSACTAGTSDVFAAGTVALGSNSCSEVPNSFISNSNAGSHLQTEVWVCPNLTNAATLVAATTDGTSVFYLVVMATEINCPTSGCVADQGAKGGNSATVAWYCNSTTNGNTAVAGDFLYTIASSGLNLFPRGTAINTTLASTVKDQYGATGPSGQKYSGSVLAADTTGNVACSGAAIKP